MTVVKSVLIHGDMLKLLCDSDTLLPNRLLPGGGGRLTRALGTKAVGERDDSWKRLRYPSSKLPEEHMQPNLLLLPCVGIRNPCNRRPLHFIFVLLHLKTH